MCDPSSSHSLHQLIEWQVKQTPDRVAVIFQNQRLTYQQLNQKANQLAHYLRNLGVGPEVLVGVCVERSHLMLVALLGILKAGGAYIPLDPAYPAERLAFMLEDSGLPVLIAEQGLLEGLPPHSAQVVCLDSDWERIVQEDAGNLDSGVTAENLAYTIYTSGSTGQPKGVQILHGAVVNFLQSMQQEPGITAQDILLAVTTISFDIAVLELFLPLTVGACVVLASREVAADARQLCELLAQSGATIMQATPATWRMLLAFDWQGNPNLKILCGGEALTRSLAEQLLERCASLWNMYGPTETTIWSTLYPVKSGSGTVPIGHPIANTQIYLRHQFSRRKNDPFKLAPPGEMGELYIGGDGLARGYLNRPDLTDERFIADPFSDKPGARLYKTGDFARYLADGSLEFIGRIDHQVKIRGFRIELGDIEAALSQHPAVKEAIAIARKDGANEERLVAYVAPKPHLLNAPEKLPDQVQAQMAAQWQELWSATYRGSHSQPDPTFNASGWIDSYTSQPIPEKQLREWVDSTVNRILALQPDRVLEIGCGLGLLLFRLAPHCSRYLATDISPEAIHYLQSQLEQHQQDWSEVTLAQQAADAPLEIEPVEFDTVVINSVIQYFPSVDYLLRVLERAVTAVKPGGRIFIGDVRNLSLLEAFHTSVALYQAPSSLSTAQLRQRIREQIAQDKELVIAPEFFTALQQHLPEIDRVEVQLKRGACHNEMTRFRYDVVLHIGTGRQKAKGKIVPCSLLPGAQVDEPLGLDWQQQALSLSKIRHLLTETAPELLRVTQIPNDRVVQAIDAQHLLSSPHCPETVGELRQVLRDLTHQAAVDPEDLWRLSQELPYHIQMDWSAASAEGRYDAVFRRTTAEAAADPWAALTVCDRAEELKPLRTYANNPLQASQIANLVPQLRAFLKEKLPEYMVPSAFVIMEALPLTPNGKLDRRALPEPSQIRPVLEEALVAPRTLTEQRLAQIWSEVLEIEPLGIHDNFFELGGHSLQVTQLIARVRATFEIELSLLSFFQMPTLASLAQAIDIARETGSQCIGLNLTRIDLPTEALLAPNIYPATPSLESLAEPQQILLTGATGFLGAFLLHELLGQTQATIYCLVRASSLEAANHKIKRNLERYGLVEDLLDKKLRKRVIPVLGDLSESLLGLSPQQFRDLASQIDRIYHGGALVNLIYPYTALRAANVQGTQEILRLASQVKLKPVHFISTLDVFQAPNYAERAIVLEQEALADGEELEHGYAQSKWVAEKLVMAAWERGIPTSIYRLGMIVGHTQTGISKTDDLVGRLIKGFIEMGSAPDLALNLTLTPVDYASQAIVHLSKQRESWGKAFHLVNPHSLPLSQLLNYLQSLGYSIEPVAYESWRSQLQSLDIAQNNALMPLKPLFERRSHESEPTYLETLVLDKFNCQNAIEGLAGTAIFCPPIDTALLDLYFSYFIQSGFLEAPNPHNSRDWQDRQLSSLRGRARLEEAPLTS
jgi:amino acid adenylation domain-containing protein/thioester reductase-like protein